MKKSEIIEEDDRSDIQKDMDTLSDVRDELLSKFKSVKDDRLKIDLASSLMGVINSRQNSELLQLRIWGLLDAHDHDEDEHCPDCGEIMHELEPEVKKNTDKN